jgi:hypothetical protein
MNQFSKANIIGYSGTLIKSELAQVFLADREEQLPPSLSYVSLCDMLLCLVCLCQSQRFNRLPAEERLVWNSMEECVCVCCNTWDCGRSSDFPSHLGPVHCFHMALVVWRYLTISRGVGGSIYWEASASIGSGEAHTVYVPPKQTPRPQTYTNTQSMHTHTHIPTQHMHTCTQT